MMFFARKRMKGGDELLQALVEMRIEKGQKVPAAAMELKSPAAVVTV
jgi:hypothetical protein